MNILEKLFGKREDKTASEYAVNCEYLFFKKDFKGALKDIDKAVKMQPENDMFYFSRSKVRKELKQYKPALEDIETAIRFQPEVKLYKNLKDELIGLLN